MEFGNMKVKLSSVFLWLAVVFLFLHSLGNALAILELREQILALANAQVTTTENFTQLSEELIVFEDRLVTVLDNMSIRIERSGR